MFSFLQKKYRNLNTIEVSASALQYNYRQLQVLHPEAKICPVLKSNAYGHGSVLVAQALDNEGAPFFVLDSLHEAYKLYKEKIKTPLLIVGYTSPENFITKKLPFHYGIYDIALAQSLNKHQSGSKVHIFVDTGMSREGVLLKDLRQFTRALKELKHIEIEGILSHFADADNPANQKFTEKQIVCFKDAIAILESEGIHPKWKHISASSGSYKHFIPECNMLRVGLACYGINPLQREDSVYSKLQLKPAMRVTSTLVQVKKISKGSKVGYNGTFTAPKDITIGIIPAGYYDLLDRRLSHCGVFQVQGKYCPIIGKVSMNMTTVDLSLVENAQVGDTVVIYSNDPLDKNYIEHTAKIAKAISYELMVHLAESVRREIVL